MKKDLHLKKTLRTAMIVLLLSVVGLENVFADGYDFSAVCSTGQTLYFKITEYPKVEVVCPNCSSVYSWNNNWDGYDKPSGNMVIPETVNNMGVAYTVTSLGICVFKDCDDLIGSIQIPNTVTKIQSSVFENCSGIISFTIPESVTAIGKSAFTHTGWYDNQPDGFLYLSNCCLGYKGEKPTGDLVIQNGTRLIATYAFEECEIGTLHFPNSLRIIGRCTFSGCVFSGGLVIPEGVVVIERDAFRNCYGFTGSLVIPNSVISIGDAAFGSEGNLEFTSLSLGSSVQEIGTGAFAWCPYFESVTSFALVPPICGDYPFSGHNIPVHVPCESYEEYESISWGGFSDFIGMGSCTYAIEVASNPLEYGLVIGGGTYRVNDTCVLKAIPNLGYVFNNWTENGTVVSQNREYSFVVRKDRNLVAHFERRTTDGYDFSEVCPSGQTLYYRIRWAENNEVEVVAPHKNNTPWSGYQKPTGNVTVPAHARGFMVTAIAAVEDGDMGGAFEDCQGVTSFNLPNSVKTIGDRAFKNCSGLTSITIPNTINSIGKASFANCNGITTITIPNTVESIREESFYGCGGLTTAIIGKSVKTIGSRAFGNCPRLNMLYYNVEEGLNAANNVFSGCPNLTTIHIGTDVKEIGSNIFKGCNTVHFVVALGSTPAVLDAGAFSAIVDNSMLMVSCGNRVTYFSVWNMFPFNNIIEDCDNYTIESGVVGNGGNVSLSSTEAQMGDEVQITVNPNPGMVLSSLVVCNASDPTQIIPVSPVGGKASSTFSFTMPPFGVVVMATFEKGTSVDEISNSIPVAVYPNPTNGVVSIKAEGLQRIEVYNTLGQLVESRQADGDIFECDLSRRVAGVYLVRMETAKGIATKRVVVTK